MPLNAAAGAQLGADDVGLRVAHQLLPGTDERRIPSWLASDPVGVNTPAS